MQDLAKIRQELLEMSKAARNEELLVGATNTSRKNVLLFEIERRLRAAALLGQEMITVKLTANDTGEERRRKLLFVKDRNQIQKLTHEEVLTGTAEHLATELAIAGYALSFAIDDERENVLMIVELQE
ncbi:hypothetical protein HN958_00740 [Candidatus Falkowbacteria bacterium]|jgi:hypothetical protein|nr:hypothetical protein [Candidatus Falkowbacteria bacterium]MBT7007017.1 hypothetical protein [Candidatus Falkowbacteria bacterium]